MAGLPPTELDELIAIWKLTRPAFFFREWSGGERWDGIAVSGYAAVSVQELGYPRKQRTSPAVTALPAVGVAVLYYISALQAGVP